MELRPLVAGEVVGEVSALAPPRVLELSELLAPV